jgi:hypothetical protein
MTPCGLPTKTHRILAFTLILATGGLSLSAMVPRPSPPESHMVAVDIDFAGLHRQASDALDSLRRASRWMPTRPDTL